MYAINVGAQARFIAAGWLNIVEALPSLSFTHTHTHNARTETEAWSIIPIYPRFPMGIATMFVAAMGPGQDEPTTIATGVIGSWVCV